VSAEPAPTGPPPCPDSRKLEELEEKVASHDEAIRSLVAAIRQLAEPPVNPKRRQIGIHVRQQSA
jgi:hypothetical protein